MPQHQQLTAMIGQQLLESDYHVHELPACDEPTNDSCSATINASLVARIDTIQNYVIVMVIFMPPF